MNDAGIVLETERLSLRCLTPADVELLLGIFSDPVAMRYYPGTKDRAETEKWIDWNLEMYERYGHGLWAAYEKNGGGFVGQVGLVRQEIDGSVETEIGYLLLRRHWGRGLASEAARGCRDFGFEVLGRSRLVALIDAHNAPSQRVAERIGMRREREVLKWGKPIYVYAIER